MREEALLASAVLSMHVQSSQTWYSSTASIMANSSQCSVTALSRRCCVASVPCEASGLYCNRRAVDVVLARFLVPAHGQCYPGGVGRLIVMVGNRGGGSLM